MMRLKKIFLGISALALLSVFSLPVFAANYAGVYHGRYVGKHQGAFALYVRPNNTAVVISYDRTTNTGFSDRRLRIKVNGTFSLKNIGGTGTSVRGRILRSGIVRGAYTTNTAAKGRFVAKRLPNAGPAKAKAGYYSGVFAAVAASCGGLKGGGKVEAILGPNGRIAVHSRVTRTNNPALWPVGVQDMGIVRMNRQGRISGRMVGGARVSGVLKGRTVTGSFIEPMGCKGRFRLVKKR